MCINKSWIFNQYNGHKYFVKCGHCPACLQEKAIKRANRIRNNKVDKGFRDDLFVTLTYDNKFIPYISRFQVKAYLSGYIHHLDIYRDFSARKVSDFKGRVRRLVKKGRCVLNSFKPGIEDRESLFSPSIDMVGIATRYGKENFVQDRNKIGVVYLPDIQNFIKRLRQNLIRKYGYEGELQYFYVCELGSETLRPHFHLDISVENGWYDRVSQCIRESWPYGHFWEKSIQRERSSASYISSYVNCISTLPDFFSQIKRFNPFHHYSKNFGFGRSNFSLSSVVDMLQRNDFGYVIQSVKDGVLTRRVIPVPLYVINKYFRKFKGFGRLTSDEIFGIASCPSTIGKFRKRIEAEDVELRRIYVTLNNLHDNYINYYAERGEVPPLPFGYVYSRIWFAYNAYKLKLCHEDVNCSTDILQLYDNLSECFYFNSDGETKGFIRNSLIKSIVDERFNIWPFPSDPNYYPLNIAKNARLTLWYEQYDKFKRKQNVALQQYNM